MSITDKLLVVVAPCIPPYMAADRPGLDLSPEGIADEVVRAYNAGANAVHLHVWDEQGQPTLHLDAFKRTLRLIRERCDIVIEGSTGGVNELSPAERCVSLQSEIEMASLNPGSINYDQGVYVNSPSDIAYWAQEMHRRGIKPDVAIFDGAMIANTMALVERGWIEAAGALFLCPGPGGRAAGHGPQPGLPLGDDPRRLAVVRRRARRPRPADVGAVDGDGRPRAGGVRGQCLLPSRRAGDQQRAVDRAPGALRARAGPRAGHPGRGDETMLGLRIRYIKSHCGSTCSPGTVAWYSSARPVGRISSVR